MGHGKLRKFAENETFSCLLQPSPEEVLAGRGSNFALKDHSVKGAWNGKVFGISRPLVLELGCGRGEYTIDLARRYPERNYIGVDIKGARLWKGAKEATLCNMDNVAFLRTRIEFIEAFFGPGEVSEIWLTFSDPQLHHENSRLSSPMFLERYRKFLKPGGLIHLKTDSTFLYEYTRTLCLENGLDMPVATDNLYGERPLDFARGDKQSCTAESICHFDRALASGEISSTTVESILNVHTYYERMFSQQGYKIKYLCFRLNLPEGQALRSPSSFDADYWRSVEGPRRSVSISS